MRREQYARNKGYINGQKRAAYQERKLTKSDNSAILNTKKAVNTRVSERGEVLNPMDREDYFRIKNTLIEQGIEVFAATEGDDLRYMLYIGAEGTYSDGRITHIGEVPSRGTLFEEIIHMEQAQKYGELSSTDWVELYAREIEANRELLRKKDVYMLDDFDVSDITNNLQKWEKAFLKATGVSYDESNYRK